MRGRACGSLPLINAGSNLSPPVDEVTTNCNRSWQTVSSQESISHLKRLSSGCLNAPQREYTSSDSGGGRAVSFAIVCAQSLKLL